MSEKTTFLTILQLTDSVFPTGGFSHSCGYEAAEILGYVCDAEAINTFVLSTLENTGSLFLPYVTAAYHNWKDKEIVLNLDKRCQACLSNHVANRASARQGRALLSSSCRAFEKPELDELQALVDEGQLRGHHAVVFGCLCASLHISLQDAASMYLFGVLRTILNSAVRLGSVGTMEAQKIQFSLQKSIPDIILRYQNLCVDDAHVSFPVVEVMQNFQDALFSKLFYS